MQLLRFLFVALVHPVNIMLWPTGKRAIAIKYGFLRNKSQTIPTNKFIQDEKESITIYT